VLTSQGLRTPILQRSVRTLLEMLSSIRSMPSKLRPKHVTIIYNPVSGAGKAKHVVNTILIPALTAALIKYFVVITKYRGHATNTTNQLNLAETDGTQKDCVSTRSIWDGLEWGRMGEQGVLMLGYPHGCVSTEY
jgi:Diacylglycerol kinase catalytic domain